MTRTLSDALGSVDWSGHVKTFCKNEEATTRCTACMTRIARWAGQIEIADSENPAIPFVREAQVQGHYIASLIALALYKPAAGAMRAVLEATLYYTYFRTHSSELATLVRSPRYYITKTSIIDYHSEHTPDFRTKEQKLGLVGRLEEWYSESSAIVHGQVPGLWVGHSDISKMKPNASTQTLCVDLFERGERIAHELLLTTTPREVWGSFSQDVRRELTKGLSKDVKIVLGL